jgi:hypothetical protein
LSSGLSEFGIGLSSNMMNSPTLGNFILSVSCIILIIDVAILEMIKSFWFFCSSVGGITDQNGIAAGCLVILPSHLIQAGLNLWFPNSMTSAQSAPFNSVVSPEVKCPGAIFGIADQVDSIVGLVGPFPTGAVDGEEKVFSNLSLRVVVALRKSFNSFRILPRISTALLGICFVVAGTRHELKNERIESEKLVDDRR